MEKLFGDIVKCIQDHLGYWHEIADAQARESLENKVDKETDKGLSSNDYTTKEKDKLRDIEAGANKTIIDDKLNGSSDNPVANKTIYDTFVKHTENIFKAEEKVRYTLECIYCYNQEIPSTPDYGEGWGTYTVTPEAYWDDFRSALEEQQPDFSIAGTQIKLLLEEKYDPEVHTPSYTSSVNMVTISAEGKIKYIYLHSNYHSYTFETQSEDEITLIISKYTHPPFGTASAYIKGTAGFVPAPPIGSNQHGGEMFLRSDGWANNIPMLDIETLSIKGQTFADSNGINMDFITRDNVVYVKASDTPTEFIKYAENTKYKTYNDLASALENNSMADFTEVVILPGTHDIGHISIDENYGTGRQKFRFKNLILRGLSPIYASECILQSQSHQSSMALRINSDNIGIYDLNMQFDKHSYGFDTTAKNVVFKNVILKTGGSARALEIQQAENVEISNCCFEMASGDTGTCFIASAKKTFKLYGNTCIALYEYICSEPTYSIIYGNTNLQKRL